ncbi:Smr domain protein, partial [Aspergillus rambellii]
IVGKGNHSANHVQKIKPRVEQICSELGLQYATEENAGRIYVNLTGGPADMSSSQSHAGNAGGYPGQQHNQPQQHYQQQQQQYPQQQQQQQHGQQQNQNQDEIEQVVNQLLPRVLRKLEKACCAIM